MTNYQQSYIRESFLYLCMYCTRMCVYQGISYIIFFDWLLILLMPPYCWLQVKRKSFLYSACNFLISLISNIYFFAIYTIHRWWSIRYTYLYYQPILPQIQIHIYVPIVYINILVPTLAYSRYPEMYNKFCEPTACSHTAWLRTKR